MNLRTLSWYILFYECSGMQYDLLFSPSTKWWHHNTDLNLSKLNSKFGETKEGVQSIYDFLQILLFWHFLNLIFFSFNWRPNNLNPNFSGYGSVEHSQKFQILPNCVFFCSKSWACRSGDVVFLFLSYILFRFLYWTYQVNSFLIRTVFTFCHVMVFCHCLRPHGYHLLLPFTSFGL